MWTEIVVALIAGLALVLSQRQGKRSRVTSKQVDEIHEEVKNSHTTNQRDDIDKAMAEARAAKRAAEAAKEAAMSAHRESLEVHVRLDRISGDIGKIMTRLSDHLDGR